jgi:hypothetical protein
MVSFYKHGNETTGSEKSEVFLEQLINGQLFNMKTYYDRCGTFFYVANYSGNEDSEDMSQLEPTSHPQDFIILHSPQLCKPRRIFQTKGTDVCIT